MYYTAKMCANAWGSPCMCLCLMCLRRPGWMATERDGNGDLQWGANFPTGHTLGDYVHSKGFKFGMYLSAGVKTCSLRDPTNRTAVGWGSYGEFK